MSAKSIRIVKEARSLFWPWCLVVCAGALRLVDPSHPELHGRGFSSALHNFIEPVSFLGFFIGLPLLATLSLGNEFQHRTLAVMLSQPIRRMEIWSEKFSVTIIAVVSAALVFGWNWRSAFREDRDLWVGAAALILIMTASAPFWTLIARSTMGGLALNSVNGFIPLIMSARRDWIPQTAITRSFAVFALLCYAGAMLWLGRRTLARFQVTGGIAGDDLLMAGPNLMPPAIAEWFRCRPTGAFLNLLRKEFRLLRPVWLISLLAVPVWICLPLFHSERGSLSAILMMVVVVVPLVAVLAGTLSFGEERSSGTHSWHLTLPVSAARLWLIKLAMAMFTSFFCAVLLPALALHAGKFIFRSPLPFDLADMELAWAIPVLILTFASFWCACTVNGTVRATLCVFPALIALLFAGGFAESVARELGRRGAMDFVVSRFHLFTNFRFTNAVSNFNPFPRVEPSTLLILVLLPTLLFAVIQSRRLFRKQLQDSTLFVLRRLLPLAIIAFLTSFSLVAFEIFVFHAKQEMWAMFRETHQAIEKIQPGLANLDAAHSLQLTAEDLAKAAPLTPRTQRWLLNSRITIATDRRHPSERYCCGGNSREVSVAPDQSYSGYLAAIDLPTGTVCTVNFTAARGLGFLGGVCK